MTRTTMAKSKTERPRTPPGEAPLDAADLALWKRVAGEAKPLARRGPARVKPLAKATEEAKAPPADFTRKQPRIVKSTSPAVPPLPVLKPGLAAGLDKSTAEKLRRGLMPVEARLDLHGYHQEEAHRALDAFIERAWRDAKRCLLVITGKGNAPASEGVLRRAVPLWLNQPNLRARILAFSEAQSRHGGGGALYVLLKRQR
jgi:DNA-nicking Smr family endonuclease